MILSGISKHWPEYYETMSDKSYSFVEAIEIMDNRLLTEQLQGFSCWPRGLVPRGLALSPVQPSCRLTVAKLQLGFSSQRPVAC